MLSTAKVASLLVFALPSVIAHGGVLSWANAGNWYWGLNPYDTIVGQVSTLRPWYSYNPIQNATDPTVACNNNGTNNNALGGTQQTVSVAAGSAVTAYWNQVWPHNTGPVLTYLAQCPGSTCNGVDSTTLKWFKIQQAGLVSGTQYNGTWAAGVMITQNSSWTTTIPATVPSGSYLIRWETIALHSMPAQFYPECAQITITGGGSLAPTAAQLVTFPGGYSNTDPGLNIDIYGQTAMIWTNYTIPGPPLYGSSGSTSSVSATSTHSTTTTPTTVASSTTHSTTSTTSTSSTSAASGTGTPVAEYGQCGGTGWTGGTTCVSPYVCTVSNAYYSQCLPA
jgi:hypothetical protein